MNEARRLMRVISLILLLGVLTLADLQAEPLDKQVRDSVASRLSGVDSKTILTMGRERIALCNELLRFYEEQQYEPVWISGRGVGEQARTFLEILRSASEQGLCPEDYHVGFIKELLQLSAEAHRYKLLLQVRHFADLEMLLTDAFLRYVNHVTVGRVDPDSIMEEWQTQPRRIDAVRLLRYSVATGQMEEFLHKIVPSHRGFQALKENLWRMRRISAHGGWPRIPQGRSLRRGDSGERVQLLNRRLRIGGDLFMDLGETFTAMTHTGVIRFQHRHGLAEDGVVDSKTLSALNVPVEARIRQIELNMERWRWMPDRLGSRHLQVNIAEFRLRAVEAGETVLDMPVVVGTSQRQTPVFSDKMSYLEFAPYWKVPATVLREDLLPRIKSDPSYLDAGHYEMLDWQGSHLEQKVLEDIDWSELEIDHFPGLLRQKPGPWNSLGRVKFMFPNPFAIYMHDTPARDLFDNRVRLDSSGCLRVKRPLDLAVWLLTDQEEWDYEKIREAMQSEEPLRVELEEAVPVHLLYWTAWVDEQERLNFRTDHYLRDASLEAALRRARGGH